MDEIYTSEKMDLDTFINHVIKYHEHFTNYCECLITKEGDIFIATPSHEQALLRFIMEKESITMDEVISKIPTYCSPMHFIADKYGIIVVWYNYLLMILEPSKIQLDILTRLNKEGILNTETICKNLEYENYKIRQKYF